MTYTLPTLRPEYSFRIDIDSETGMSFLAIYCDRDSEPPYCMVSYALPFMPNSYAYAIAVTASVLEDYHPDLFVDSPTTERSRYEHALNTLLEENNQ